MSSTSRNAAVLPPAIAAAIAPKLPAGPDSELIRLCADYEALEREIEALYEDSDDADGTGLGLITDKMSPLLRRMEEIHAKTPAGIHARARVAGVCNPGGGFTWDDDDTVPGRILAVLLRDAMALGGSQS